MSTATAPAAPEQRYSVTENYLSGPHGPMRYWASEPRQGLPVLFIHGYGALIEHWRSIMRPVARRHTFYALDLYGFGYSARPSDVPSKQRWADQIATFIKEVIGGPAVVVGHSMGGAVTTELARCYGDLARAIVLVNSSGMQLHERTISSNDRFMLDLIGAPLVGELAAGLFANEWGIRQSLLSSYYRKDRVTPELVQTFTGPVRRYGAGSYLAVTRNSLKLVVELQPGEYSGPTLVIWGSEDRSIPPTDADKLKRLALPQAEIHLLPESGHCCFDETPEAFCDVLLPWLERQGAQR